MKIVQHQILQYPIEKHQIVQHENSATSNSTVLKYCDINIVQH